VHQLRRQEGRVDRRPARRRRPAERLRHRDARHQDREVPDHRGRRDLRAQPAPAEGTLTREGDAEGTAQIEQAGTTVDLTFVIVGDKIYIKGPTGGYQELPLSLAATVYDPSAILDPDKGVAKVLTSATDAKTEAGEAVDGTDAWRVAITANGADLSTIIPGVTGNTPGKVWLGKQDKRLHKAVFTLPADGGATGTVTVTFQEFDAPAAIKAP